MVSPRTDGVDEDRWIAWLRHRVRRLGWDRIGDDGAVLPAGGPWVTTVDTQIEGVHFFPGLDPRLVARRLLAVNLSDLAAMGAEPTYGFLALTASPGFDLKRFFEAFIDASHRHGVELAGGDLSRSDRVSAALTLVGKASPGGGPARDAARPGDRLWLGGTVGESGLGFRLLQRGARHEGRRIQLPDLGLPRRLEAAARRAVRRHLLPTPQLELGRRLGERRRAAALDVSDGLAKDLHRLCGASGVGAVLDAERLPMPEDSQRLAGALGIDWRGLALGGGEDYVLLFALPEDEAPPKGAGATAIGRIRRRQSVEIDLPEGRRPLDPLGWDHLVSA